MMRRTLLWRRSAGLVIWGAGLTCAAMAQPRFTDVTLEAGITHLHRLAPDINEVTWMAGGAVAEDFNGDGWIDLYALESILGVNHLYINQRDGTFIDEASSRGAQLDGNYFGATAADYDNDGDIDILLTRRGSYPELLKNNGTGVFTVQRLVVGEPLGSAMSASWGDVDNDGLLDAMTGTWDFQGDNLRIYKNTGAGFELYDFRTAPFDDVFVFSPRFADVNNDRLSDLLVVCDFGHSQLYLNRGEGMFERVTASHGIGSDENGMGSAVGDYDNDGDLDWFVSSIWDSSGVVEGHWGVTGNRLYRNLGDGGFTNVTMEAGVHDGNWGWGSAFGDFDNDGDLDIYHVNGWAEARFPSVPSKFNNQPARLFLSEGDGTFVESAVAAGAANTGQGRGLVLFDYDNDGDLDIYIANNQELVLSPPARLPGKPALLRNDTPKTNAWLKVALRGRPPLHRDGIGSRVYVTAGGVTRMHEMNASTGFLAHGPGRVGHFGLGDAEIAQEVRAEWVSGDATVLRDVELNSSVGVPSPTAVVSARRLSLGESVVADGTAVEPIGSLRYWWVEGESFADPMETHFSTPGRKELELRIYAEDGSTFLRSEIVRVDVEPLRVGMEYDRGSGEVILVWPSVPGWRYRVRQCDDVADPQWEPASEPVVAGEQSPTRLRLPPAARTRFYQVGLE